MNGDAGVLWGLKGLGGGVRCVVEVKYARSEERESR